jgi:hypothetical protein
MGVRCMESDGGANAAAVAVESFSYKQELKRSLSPFDLLVYERPAGSAAPRSATRGSTFRGPPIASRRGALG